MEIIVASHFYIYKYDMYEWPKLMNGLSIMHVSFKVVLFLYVGLSHSKEVDFINFVVLLDIIAC